MGYWGSGPFDNDHCCDLAVEYVRQLRAGKTSGQAEAATRASDRVAGFLRLGEPWGEEIERALRLIREGRPEAEEAIRRAGDVLDDPPASQSPRTGPGTRGRSRRRFRPDRRSSGAAPSA